MAIQVQPQWTEMVQIAGGKLCKGEGGDVHWFLLPHYVPDYDGAWPESGPMVFEANPAASAFELWPMQAGWCDEVERISKCLGLPLTEVIIKLQDLVQPPSLSLLRKYDDELNQSIEKGLLLSNRLNLSYFSEGVHWVGKMFGAFGYLFPDDRYIHLLFLWWWLLFEFFVERGHIKSLQMSASYTSIAGCGRHRKLSWSESWRMLFRSHATSASFFVLLRLKWQDWSFYVYLYLRMIQTQRKFWKGNIICTSHFFVINIPMPRLALFQSWHSYWGAF